MSDQKPKSIRSSRKATKVDADSEDSARSRSMSGGRSRSLPDEMKASAKSSGRNQSKYKRISKIVSSSEGEDVVGAIEVEAVRGEIMYIGRALHENDLVLDLVPGKVHKSHGVLYVPRGK